MQRTCGKHTTATVVLLVLIGSVSFSAACLADSQADGKIEGQVIVGPLCPVEPCEVSEEMLAQAYAARKVEVYTPDRSRLVQEAPLNATGYYEVSLPPGTYLVDIARTGIDTSPQVPREVAIPAGGTVRLDIEIDTGIR
jgi:hypothetical protein